MKEEDIDWLVFHLVDTRAATTHPGLVVETGLTGEEIEASIERLVGAMLLEVRGETIVTLSLQEMLIRNQCRYDQALPFVLENGVVRLKKGS